VPILPENEQVRSRTHAFGPFARVSPRDDESLANVLVIDAERLFDLAPRVGPSAIVDGIKNRLWSTFKTT